jgi:hypothetical protein
MNKTEIEKIAKAIAQATAQWLADKRKERPKISPLFSESHLIIPAAEYLIDDNWDKLGTEKHSAELFDKGNAGDVNYDLSATKDNETLLIETKLLKKTSEPRLIKDFVKLAFPTNGSGYSSLYLIAESTIAESVFKPLMPLKFDQPRV